MLHVTITRDHRRDESPAPGQQVPPTVPSPASTEIPLLAGDETMSTVVLPRVVTTAPNPVVLEGATGTGAVMASGYGGSVEVPPASTTEGRAPAPGALRAGVVGLSACLLLAVGYLAVAHERPGWIRSLRHEFSRSAPVAHAATAPVAARFVLETSLPKHLTYTVPSATYSIALSIQHPCWVVVRSPAAAPTPLLARTLEPSNMPAPLQINGTSSIVLAAQAEAITISNGAKVLGVIRQPVLGTTYSFVPSRHPAAG